MTNMLETASKWLSDQLDEHVSSAVHYRRGSTVVPLVAGKGRTQFETTDAFNMLILVESRDFLISTTAILLDGVQSLPQVGDQILETVEGELHAYEVLTFGTDQPYRFCDPYRNKLRIHTKHIGVVTSL